MNEFFARQGAAFRNDLNRSLGALVGITQGLLCDGHLTDDEIRFLNNWLTQNESISLIWPGDVLHSRLRDILADGIITNDERAYLTETLQQLVGGSTDDLAEATHVTELALDRSVIVTIPDSTFCLTGDFVFATRSHCESVICNRGGIISKSVTKKTNYLVVGGLGSPEWKNGSFGTKIEKAMEYKSKGVPIHVVHEDQWANAIAI